jgi:carboxyl-terminal processing protease
VRYVRTRGAFGLWLASLAPLMVLAACGGAPAVAEPAPEPVIVPVTSQKEACPSWAGLDVQSLPPLPDTPYTATFEQVWRIVQEKHFDPTLGCQDWPALRLEFGGRLAHAKDASEAYATMNALLATLKQSHFKVVPPGGAVESEASGPARAPVHVRMIEGQLLVVDAALGGIDSGVPRGAVLVAVDGKPVAEIVRKIEATALRPDEVAFHAMLAVEAALHGAPGATRTLRFLDPTNADVEVTREVTCVIPGGEMVTIGNLRDIPTTVTHVMIPGTKVGHLAFNYWMLPMVERVRGAMAELRAMGMTGLVLDLRGNPGGVGAMSIPVARMLLTRPGSLGKLQFRDFAQEFNVAADPAAFTGPVIVLVDEGTASTSEIFAAGLRDLERAQVFGSRPSAGAALPSLVEVLQGGALLQYVVGDYHSSRGAVAEGDGVRPDVLVPETRADFIAGRDPVLEAAVKALSAANSDSGRAPVEVRP